MTLAWLQFLLGGTLALVVMMVGEIMVRSR